MNKKASRKLKILRTLVAVFLLPVALLGVAFLYSTVTDSEGRHYEKMKQACQEEMWAVVYDSPWHHVQEVEKPYPANRDDVLAGSFVTSLACSEQEANEIRDSRQRSGGVIYFAAMGLFLAAPVILLIILWWIIEETRYWLARSAAR